jgi:hypothetical protein
VRGDQKVYAKGFGTRHVGTQSPVDADTVFQLASVSKSLGGTLVAQQVGLGRVQWDTRLRSVLPWFALSDARASDEVTIADMYSHRSGLPLHAGDRLEDMGYDRRRFRASALSAARSVPRHLLHEFRDDRWRRGHARRGARRLGYAVRDCAHRRRCPRTASRTGLHGEANRAVGHAGQDGQGGVRWCATPTRNRQVAQARRSTTWPVGSPCCSAKVSTRRRVIDAGRSWPRCAADADLACARRPSGSYYGFGFRRIDAEWLLRYNYSGANGWASPFQVVPRPASRLLRLPMVLPGIP